jgi:hypothetical protein
MSLNGCTIVNFTVAFFPGILVVARLLGGGVAIGLIVFCLM